VIFFKEGIETVYQTETVYDDVTGLPVRQLTTLNDVLQSPPDDTPAQVLFDEQGRIREMVWWDNGKEHRDIDKGPAKIKINPENGVHVVERFKRHGETTRSRAEPALVIRDPDTGEVVRNAFYVDGVEVSPQFIEPLEPGP